AACDWIEPAGDEAQGGKARARRTYDDEFIAQPLAGKKGGIGVDVARSHVTHGEAVDVQAIDERPKDGTIDKPAEPPEERPMPAQHSGQRAAPSRGDENEPRPRPRGACGQPHDLSPPLPPPPHCPAI